LTVLDDRSFFNRPKREQQRHTAIRNQRH
jgi:hypothetical protein